jgi:hypothetical protein
VVLLQYCCGIAVVLLQYCRGAAAVLLLTARIACFSNFFFFKGVALLLIWP